jgi:GT2 family glycosyltransferase
MNNLKTAIVILNWNGKYFLEKFLPAVVKYSPKNSVFVADNCSNDDSVEFIKSNFPDVTLVLNDTNGGFAKGYNDALKNVYAEYYVLLNSDVEVTENWIDPIIEFMDKNPDVSACQPKILSYNNKSLFEYAGACGGFIDKYGYPFCRGRIFDFCETDNGQYNSIKEIFWATGACMFVRAEVFKKLNGFDEDFFAHMEEIDLCWRMKNKGHKIFAIPQSIVYHVGGGTLHKSNPKKTFLNFRNSLITILKNDNSNSIYLKIFFRLLLDGIAGLMFLFKGNFADCFAIIKAHFSFYFDIKKTNQKRKQLLNDNLKIKENNTVYQKSIVFQFYLKKRKKYNLLIDFLN